MITSLNVHKRNKIIASILPSIFLLSAILDGLPYSFFTLLKLIVFFTNIYLVWLALVSKKHLWVWVYGLIVIVFNPIIPLYFERDIWIIIDVLTAFLLIISIFIFKLPKS